ncbi:protein EVI2B-like [Narcine bancroftii]|uniref:protein EVI2B-like n=1 Tax=Narcine bancroftii TaxID=1343680 RepID=UPI0038310FC3
MEVIQLTTLALLATGLSGVVSRDHGSTKTLIRTNMTASPTLQELSTQTSPTMNAMNTISLVNNLPNSTSNSMNTSSITSQTTMNVSLEPSISNFTPQPTSPITSMNQTTKFNTMRPVTQRSTTSKPTDKYLADNVNVSMIIAYIIGGLLVLLVISTIGILLGRRWSRAHTMQDFSWAGTCPDPTGDDPEHESEGCDLRASPTKRPSLTTFLSRKSKRNSLLDQNNMEVQDLEGINNLASNEMEENILSDEVKGVDEEASELLTSTKTQGQELAQLEEPATTKEDDQQTPLPAADAEASRSSQGVPDADTNNDVLPLPPIDILDLVNDSDLPPPL